MDRLELSTDRKTTPVAKFTRDKGFESVVKNTIATLAGITCKWATDFCLAVCYAFNVENRFSNARKLAARNTERMKSGRLIQKYQVAIDDYRHQLALAKKRPLPFEPKNLFRHHYDGDISSTEEARAIRAAAVKNPDIAQWIYTRRFDLAHIMLGVPNLKVYLSVDMENWEKVPKNWVRDGGLLAFTGMTWDDTEKLSRRLLWRNSPRCPELTKKIPLVVDRGTGEDGTRYGEGACAACMMCPNGVNHVQFAVKR